MAECDITGCKSKTSYNYDWVQGEGVLEIWLCRTCHYQLLGEMLKQLMIEKMVEEPLEK